MKEKLDGAFMLRQLLHLPIVIPLDRFTHDRRKDAHSKEEPADDMEKNSQRSRERLDLVLHANDDRHGDDQADEPGK